jgi:hypothetical protein
MVWTDRDCDLSSDRQTASPSVVPWLASRSYYGRRLDGFSDGQAWRRADGQADCRRRLRDRLADGLPGLARDRRAAGLEWWWQEGDCHRGGPPHVRFTNEPIVETTVIAVGVSREWGDHAALADRSFWLACG